MQTTLVNDVATMSDDTLEMMGLTREDVQTFGTVALYEQALDFSELSWAEKCELMGCDSSEV